MNEGNNAPKTRRASLPSPMRWECLISHKAVSGRRFEPAAYKCRPTNQRSLPPPLHRGGFFRLEGSSHLSASKIKRLPDMGGLAMGWDELDERDWLKTTRSLELSAQMLRQAEGFAIILLRAKRQVSAGAIAAPRRRRRSHSHSRRQRLLRCSQFYLP